MAIHTLINTHYFHPNLATCHKDKQMTNKDKVQTSKNESQHKLPLRHVNSTALFKLMLTGQTLRKHALRKALSTLLSINELWLTERAYASHTSDSMTIFSPLVSRVAKDGYSGYSELIKLWFHFCTTFKLCLSTKYIGLLLAYTLIIDCLYLYI